MDEPLHMETLDDVRRLIDSLPGPDRAATAAAAAREPQLTKPRGSLGRLEILSAWLATWQGRHPPQVDRIAVHVFAGNHGVATRGVSAFPPEVTAQMVANFEAGGAAINQICRSVGAELAVHALDLDTPTEDITQAPAMSEDEFVAAMRRGAAVADTPADLICLGEMGIGNTTAAAALACALYGRTAAEWAGPGTGLDAAGLARKAAVVEAAVQLHQLQAADELDLLRRLGGRELAAIAGAVIGARMRRIPVILDGFICSAAAAPLMRLREDALDHCVVSHMSAEPGHRRLLEELAKRALLSLDMRLGEASGAALAASIVRAAAACHAGMATFADAGVSDRD